MAKISYSKEDLAGANYPEGVYEVRLDGFEPAYSKKRDSINLNPILKIVNHQTLNGKQVGDNLNSSANWIVESFCHCFGQALTPNASGGGDLPGDFIGPDDKPEEWQYTGPLTGSVGKVYLKTTSYNGRERSKVDQWFCAVPGCNTQHANGLAK